MCHIEIRRCRDDAGQSGRNIQRIPHFLPHYQKIVVDQRRVQARAKQTSITKGTPEHKNRIINLQGKHKLAYISAIVYLVYVKLVVRKYLHASCEIIRCSRTKNKVLGNIKSFFPLYYVRLK